MPSKAATHVPGFRSGCYYARFVDCCWLCCLRISAARLGALLSALVRRRGT